MNRLIIIAFALLMQLSAWADSYTFTNTASPWTVSTNIPPGTWTVWAEVRTSDGTNAVSTTNTFAIENQPTITLDTVFSGQVFTSIPLSLSATATPSVGTITNVSFFLNGTLISSDTTAPYTAVASPANGYFTLTATVADDHGLTNISTGVQIQVNVPTIIARPAQTGRSGKGLFLRRN